MHFRGAVLYPARVREKNLQVQRNSLMSLWATRNTKIFSLTQHLPNKLRFILLILNLRIYVYIYYVFFHRQIASLNQISPTIDIRRPCICKTPIMISTYCRGITRTSAPLAFPARTGGSAWRDLLCPGSLPPVFPSVITASLSRAPVILFTSPSDHNHAVQSDSDHNILQLVLVWN